MKDIKKEFCNMRCGECYDSVTVKNPIFKIGDLVEFNSPKSNGNGMIGTIIGNTRCEILNTNIYKVQYKKYIIGFCEKDHQLKLAKKDKKLTDFG